LGRPVHASMLFHSGDHPTLRLRTAEGHELTGTHNHPVLTVAAVAGVPLLIWKLLEEITPGDTLAAVPEHWHKHVVSLPELVRAGGAADHDRRGAPAEASRVVGPALAGDYFYA